MNRCMSLAATLLLAAMAAAAEPLPVKDLKVDLDMGTRRVNWNNARWVVVPLDKPVDLRAAAGLRITVDTEQPRRDAGVYVAVREASGTWHAHPWAVDLTQKQNAGVALFEDFCMPEWYAPPDGVHRDQNTTLDLDQINAIAFGCVNPLGVGKVSFTVRQVTPMPAAQPAAAPSKVEVSGRPVDINGTTTLPAGAFGSFNMAPGATVKYRLAMDRRLFAGGGFGKPSSDPVTHMLINCYGDRGIAPAMMFRTTWKNDLAAAAKTAAEAAKATGKTYYVEWWNEPYLNWSNKNRCLYRWEFFDESRAVEGGPVHLKIDGSLCPHLKWTQNFDALPYKWFEKRFTADGRDNWRRGRTAAGEVPSGHAPGFHGSHKSPVPATHPPKELKDGEKYTAFIKGKETELTAFTPWWVYDETQFTYWSAKGAGRFYNEPLMVAGKALKTAHPATVLLAGWGFRPSEDHWDAFRLEYQPTIDQSHELIDGITDHDYGGDAIKMPSSYELVTAYGATRYNKWLHSYNTETASGSDPGVHGDSSGSIDQQKFRWTARKLIHALHAVPDKVRSLAWFRGEPNAFSDAAEGVLFTMLINLRGKLMHVRTDDPMLYAVAAIDGADPQNPRPESVGPGKELVVAILNDHPTTHPVSLTVRAPAGTKFSGLKVRRPIFKADGTIEVEEKQEKCAEDSHSFAGEIPSRQLVSLSFALTGDPSDATPAVRKQSFSPTFLSDVAPDKPVTHKIAVKADDLKAAKRAWVRVVVERVAEGEGVVAVNGKDYTLPKAVTPENAAWIRDIPVALSDLKTENELVFRVSSPAQAGYLMVTSSLYLESE